MTRVLALLCAACAMLLPRAPAAADRPAQYVAIAFDNCTELERWQEWSDFAAALERDGIVARFTFFVSGINFIADARKDIYQPPREPRGRSRINFGGTPRDVASRIGYINGLRRKGHEIASHAVGHFDGRHWSAADWQKEFDSFDTAFAHIAAVNDLAAGAGFDFPVREIAGFRAPYLATSPGLYEVMSRGRFRYHANGGKEPDAWPVKEGGLWAFSLANIRLAGGRRRTLSMDYNFLVAQSLGLDDARNRDRHRQQMLESYLDYFRANYAGNRAPIHIGHHFSDYQGGAYREALKDFVRSVCGLPEVRCTTYARLADFLDALDPQTLAAYRAGGFARAEAPALAAAAIPARPPAATAAR